MAWVWVLAGRGRDRCKLREMGPEILANAVKPPGLNWIEGVGEPTDANEWRDGWRSVLSWLNHHRDTMRGRVGGLVLVLPEWLSDEPSRVASDLWSVRNLVCYLGNDDVRVSAPTASELPRLPAADAASSHVGLPLRLTGEPIPEPTAGNTLARTDTDPESTRDLVARALKAGSLQLAAVGLLRLAEHDQDRGRAGQTLGDALALGPIDPKTRVELLREQFRRQVEAGVWNSAETAAHESLAISRALNERLATPEALRDLSISLNNVGLVHRARGEWTEAKTIYDESLAIRRALNERLATPEALRDLTVSLNNVGLVHRARGEWTEAKTIYDESLAIRRALNERLATPEALRDLTISLNNVGLVHQARGEWTEAKTIYDESLAISRALNERLATPQSVLDIAWVLRHLAEAALIAGDRERVRELTTEAGRLAESFRSTTGSVDADDLLAGLASSQSGSSTDDPR